MEQVLNYYACKCGNQWANTWTCACNDKCPNCNKEIEPYKSEEINHVEEEVVVCESCNEIIPITQVGIYCPNCGDEI